MLDLCRLTFGVHFTLAGGPSFFLSEIFCFFCRSPFVLSGRLVSRDEETRMIGELKGGCFCEAMFWTKDST